MFIQLDKLLETLLHSLEANEVFEILGDRTHFLFVFHMYRER